MTTGDLDLPYFSSQEECWGHLFDFDGVIADDGNPGDSTGDDVHAKASSNLEGTDLKLEGTGLNLEGTDLKLEGTGLNLEGTDLKLEGTGDAKGSSILSSILDRAGHKLPAHLRPHPIHASPSSPNPIHTSPSSPSPAHVTPIFIRHLLSSNPGSNMGSETPAGRVSIPLLPMKCTFQSGFETPDGRVSTPPLLMKCTSQYANLAVGKGDAPSCKRLKFDDTSAEGGAPSCKRLKFDDTSAEGGASSRKRLKLDGISAEGGASLRKRLNFVDILPERLKLDDKSPKDEARHHPIENLSMPSRRQSITKGITEFRVFESDVPVYMSSETFKLLPLERRKWLMDLNLVFGIICIIFHCCCVSVGYHLNHSLLFFALPMHELTLECAGLQWAPFFPIHPLRRAQ